MATTTIAMSPSRSAWNLPTVDPGQRLGIGTAVDGHHHPATANVATEDDPMKTVLSAALCGLAIGMTAWAQPTEDRRTKPPHPAAPDEIVLSFRGLIDGSDRIQITPTGATWRHLYWQMPPEPVTLNGIAWDPSRRRTLENQGETRFLPRPVDFASARLKRIRGRDTVALERGEEGVVIHINDTPFEASLYEFQVVFRPRNSTAGGKDGARARRPTLQVVAEIDGSDELHVDARGARWVHREWEWPREVRLNGVAWDPERSPTLRNDGATRFLPGAVDVAKARLTRDEARDTAVLEPTEEGLVLIFADSPPDRSTYDVTITFGD
jgi:hypothetical protein